MLRPSFADSDELHRAHDESLASYTSQSSGEASRCRAQQRKPRDAGRLRRHR